MKLNVYSPSGEKKEQVFVSTELAEAKGSDKLIAQAILANLNNLRRPIADTKDRSEVSGGGRKPWRQKGTGRARAGSTRSPIWIGGGVTFGPRREQNYTRRLPKAMAKKALQIVLAQKIKENKFIVVSEIAFKEIKTAQMQTFLEKLPIEEGKILLILSKTNPTVELSAANLKYIKTVQISGVRLIDILNYDYILTDKEGLNKIEAVFGRDKKSKKKV